MSFQPEIVTIIHRLQLVIQSVKV